jgi:transcription initiation factor TFIIIB Brf1 subunit/transcription initiation factor TFIIB
MRGFISSERKIAIMLKQAYSVGSRAVYNTDNDQHIRAIDSLVNELGIPAEEVNRSYREVLEELNKEIKVKAFLPILVSRVVKDRLLQHR